jgi:hypothetical protein
MMIEPSKSRRHRVNEVVAHWPSTGEFSQAEHGRAQEKRSKSKSQYFLVLLFTEME